MNHSKITFILFFVCLALISSAHADKLNVCATTPELGDLSKLIGGDQVEVTVFVKGQEDPHALVAKPSDVLKLSQADALVIMGLGLETGWVPALMDRSRNSRIRASAKGYIDASKVIEPIQDFSGEILTRAMGHIHPEGNPHYMLDPVNGLKVARLLAQSFSELKPMSKEAFTNQLKTFEQNWGVKAFGETLPKRYPLDKLIEIQDRGKLEFFLTQTGEMNLLGGWFGNMSHIKGAKLIADHEQWNYFSKRFSLNVDRAIEPKPGVPAGARHLQELVEWMKANNITGVLASPYFSPRHLEFIMKHTEAEILAAAHQVGSRPQADTYFNMIDHNVRIVCECCRRP